MKRSTIIASILAVVSLFTMIAPRAVAAQSASGTIAVTYTKTESITVNVAGSVTIAADGSSNAATVTGTYNLVAANHTNGIRIAVFPAGGLLAALTGPGGATVASSHMAASLNGQWAAGTACTLADGDNINGGVADQCFAEGGAVGTASTVIVPQATVNTTPNGNLPSSTIGFGFAPTGYFPPNAGTYNGNFTVLVYAL